MTSSITTIIFTLFYASVRQMLNSLETKIGIKSTLIIYNHTNGSMWLTSRQNLGPYGTAVAGFQLGSMDSGFSDEIHRVRKIQKR